MKYITLSIILSFCICLSINAQKNNDLSQAKIDFKNREFVKALPIFEKEYNIKPTDPSLNLWYGICLVETNTDIKRAEEHLLVAANKNMTDAYLYLGDIYSKEYKIKEAKEYYNKYAKAKPKEKETTLNKRYEYVEEMQKLISRTEDIQIIDSLIIDKSEFLSAYNLSWEEGSLSGFNSVFETSSPVESVIFANGRGNKIYFGQPVEGKYFLSTMDKLLNGLGHKKLMSDNNFGLNGDTNYPFVMNDGLTLYFAGKEDNRNANYNIYVTSYNLNNDDYLTPQILNMPYNSTANDYMMVVDETKGVGWFTTDRFQPEGKVCVYTFIPNDEITLLETDDEMYRERRARITSIKDTWRPGNNYDKLILDSRKVIEKVAEKIKDFTFIVDDNHTYYTYNDFKNSNARNLYKKIISKQRELDSLKREIDKKRIEYNNASQDKKESLSGPILNMENIEYTLQKEISDLLISTRNEEINSIN